MDLGRKKLGNPLFNGYEEVVQFAVHHLLADFVPEEEEGHWSEDDEMFVFRKEI